MEDTYKKAHTDKKQEASLLRMPKNIRQIGMISNHTKAIYVEDYVMTFIKQLSRKDYSGCKAAVLLGYYISTEDYKSIFVKGAVEMQNVDFSNQITFSDETWTNIYENIKQYFTDVEIVGWALMGPEFMLESGERIRKIHTDNFPGPDKVLLKVDNLEKEEAFYLYENNQLVKQNGYYIYYEKNEDMQNYMVETREVVSEEKNYEDHATTKIRTIIKEKKENKDEKSSVRLLYAASSLLAIVVIIIAAVNMQYNGQLKSMREALNDMSSNLSKLTSNTKSTEVEQTFDENTTEQTTSAETSDSNQSSDRNQSSQEDQNKVNTTEAAKEQETMEVETIAGNVQAEDTSSESVDQTAKSDQTVEDKKTSSNKEEGKTETNKQTASNKDTKNTDGEKSQDQTASKGSNKETVPASSTVNYYVVKQGDTLASICYKLYNSVNNLEKIKTLNGIEDEDKILAGQKLIVP